MNAFIFSDLTQRHIVFKKCGQKKRRRKKIIRRRHKCVHGTLKRTRKNSELVIEIIKKTIKANNYPPWYNTLQNVKNKNKILTQFAREHKAIQAPIFKCVKQMSCKVRKFSRFKERWSKTHQGGSDWSGRLSAFNWTNQILMRLTHANRKFPNVQYFNFLLGSWKMCLYLYWLLVSLFIDKPSTHIPILLHLYEKLNF